MADYPGGRVGQQFGKYRLVRLLGAGGFAEVYLGEHIHLGSQAAIKVLDTHLLNDDATQFLQEARMIARLSHPHIVRVWDCDVEHGVPFIVMSYAPRGNLRHLHPKGQSLPLSQVVSYTRQVASALQYAHDLKLIHRDVKPENMLAAKDGVIWLSDFGIATMAHSSLSQRTQSVVGSMPYIAPEQIHGYPLPASDQYALAVVVYEWLSGGRPFHGTSAELAVQHIQMQPPPFLQNIPGLPHEVEEVVMIALAKDYRARFVNVSAFAKALEEASNPSTYHRATGGYNTTLPESFMSSRRLPTYSEQREPILSFPSENIQVSIKKIQPNRVNRRTVSVGVLGALLVAGAGGYLTWLRGLQNPTAPVGAKKGPTPGPTTFVQTPKPTRPPIVQGKLLFKFTGHTDVVNWVSWSPDSKRVVSASGDRTAQVWNALDGGNLIKYTEHNNAVYVASWLPKDQLIATGGADHTVRVWNGSTGKDLFVYTGHKDSIGHLAWSPDGKRIASSSNDRTVQVWNALDGGNPVTYTGHQNNGVFGVAWSPDGKYISSGGLDGTVHIWIASDAGHVFTYTGHTKSVLSVSWQPGTGYRIASGGTDATVQVWNAMDGTNAFTYTGHAGLVYSVCWSPNGKRIASSSQDKTVRLWNAVDGGNTYIYSGHGRPVNAVAWSPDGASIASGGEGMAVNVWVAG